MEYEKEVFVYIPTDATFEDVQQILIASRDSKPHLFAGLLNKKTLFITLNQVGFCENGMNNNELMNLRS